MTQTRTLELIRAALDEDVGDGDWTSRWTVEEHHECSAVVVAKSPLVVAGSAVAQQVFAEVDRRLAVDVALEDGDLAESEDVVLRVRGRTRAVLAGERTVLNFLARLSGVATLTRRYVREVAHTGARIVDTRKTTPGWRALEKAAVRAGGGSNHRLGLYDMVLVKDNHVDAAGSVTGAVRAVQSGNDRGLRVEVEVRTPGELEEAL